MRLALAFLVLAAGAPGCAPGAAAPASAPAPAPATTPALARAITATDSMIQAGVERQFPGAVFVVAKDGVVLHERAFGWAQLNDYAGHRLAKPRPMRTSTMFDLASVRKVMATTMAVMRLVDLGRVDLDAPVWHYLPDFRGRHLDSITVRHLLQHSAGLVQWQPLYYQASTAAQAYAAIRAMPLEWGVGAGRHYSDFSFMLLGYLVERVAGEPLDAYVKRQLYDPLGLHATTFLPRRHGFTEFAATESGNVYERHMVYDSTFGYRYRGDPTAWNGWRTRVLDGEVDDGNAYYAHGGVAGHAGLFSTASDLHVLLDVLVARGTARGHRVFRPEVVDRFLTRDRYEHYLGWQYPTYTPPGSFAHTGFTGTWVLGVPKYGLSVVLLTNKQNLGTDARGNFANLAPLQEAVARALVAGAAAAAGR